MILTDRSRAALLCSVAIAAISTSAAQAAPDAPLRVNANQEILGEVVVTATRQADTVNRVPLSVTAVTQASIDKAGVKNLEELSRTVPSVTLRKSSEGSPSIAIRGLSSTLGAPTTAVYLDDTPLQKRDIPGATTGNGTPLPALFDLERVEILRGPQGTLFGGSAEGGAIRFITPAPSLTKYSVYARTEASAMKGGDPSYEAGLAVGGPIIQDKLGFRASVWGREGGGYMDHVSIYDAHEVASNTNNTVSQAVRGALTWAASDRLRITPAYYWSQEHGEDSDVFWENVPAFTVNSGYFTNKGTVNGVAFNFADKLYQGGTYGPYNQFGPYKTPVNLYLDEKSNAREASAPRTTTISLPTLTFDYEFENMSVKAITSLLHDKTTGYSDPGGFGLRAAVLPTSTNSGFVSVASHTGPDVGTAVPGGIGSAALTTPGFPTTYNELHYNQSRRALTQEIRFSSAANARPLSWVAGVFYSNAISNSHTFTRASEEQLVKFIRGIDEAWLLGNTNFPDGNYSARIIHMTENEVAAFGEANYFVTSKLKATAGVRLSRDTIKYDQATGSAVQGAPPGFVGTPGAPTTVTDPNCGINPVACNGPGFHPFPNLPGDDPYTRFAGTQTASPINPKFGLSYQANDNDLYYVTAAKGYRAGGLNQPTTSGNCGPDLAALGLTGIGTPLTYGSDSVWSYEGGAKLRLLNNKLQLNSSVFYINWKNPQLNVKLRCNQTYIINAGEAVSKGADVQAQGRLFGVTVGISVSYTDARYTQDVILPAPAGVAPNVFAQKGEQLGAPKWQYALTAQYDFQVYGQYDAYIRGDYEYSSPYQRGVGPGDVGYDAVIAKGAQTHYGNLRAGVNVKRWDVSAFVKNVTNSQDRLFQSHTAASSLINSSTFRPREIGLSASYRY